MAKKPAAWSDDIIRINGEAKKLGLSYGQYVAKLTGGPLVWRSVADIVKEEL